MQVHEEEHARRKRNADAAMKFASANPITRTCDRPGYTGQYCEFPICNAYNPINNPEQYLGSDGYVVDLTYLGNCTMGHQIIVDESMVDIRIEVQSMESVYPKFTVYDDQGRAGDSSFVMRGEDLYIQIFAELKPGYYTVQTTAASNSRCILQTTAKTFVTISGGFLTDDRDRSDFPVETASANDFNSILLHLNGARSPSELKTVSVIGPDNQVLRPRLFSKRYGCQYEYYFDSFFCYDQGTFAMTVEGIDFYGLPFRRTVPFKCIDRSISTTPSPSTTLAPSNPTSCANGGVLYYSGATFTCICQYHWGGYDCSQPLCTNGGTKIGGKCFCTIGFEGQHCEIGGGTRKVWNCPIYGVHQQVQQAVDQVVTNLQFDPGYLTRFSVVFFNDHNNFMAKHYTSIEQFDNDFYKATIAATNEGGCTDGVLEALATGLTSLALTQGSTIYVITDALADDYDTSLEAILQLNSYWRATINFVYVEPTEDSLCTSDLSDPGFRAFDEVANRFGGLAWHVDDRSRVYDVLYGHMNSILYKSQLMLTFDRDECSSGLGKVIQMEKNSDSLVFIAKGRDFSLEIIAPDGTTMIRETVVDDGIFTIQRSTYTLAGPYMIRAKTKAPTASCSLRAYQASYHSYSPDSPVEAFWAITTDVDVDAFLYQPVAGTDNHPVFHVANNVDSKDYDTSVAFLNMYAVRGGVEKEVYASNGLFRAGCTFDFYFPSFRCRPNENLYYEFTLRTDQGFYIQRAGVMTCFNYIPTPAPPSDCLNGGVMVNGTCLCQPHFEGAKCQSVICDNDASAVFGICQCTAGWTGPFCTFPKCSSSGPLPTYGYHVDMAFLVEVTKSGVGQIQQLVSTLPEIIRDVVGQHPDWIDRLVLIGYNSIEVVGMVDTPISDTKEFFDTLNRWGYLNPTDDGCVVKTWAALDQLLNGRTIGFDQRYLPERSIVNVFETAKPSDADRATMFTTSELFLERKAITNVFQMKYPSTGGWRCGAQESNFGGIEQLARRGDGKMYTIDTSDLSKALRMIPTLFSSSIVYKFHAEDCSVGRNVFFPVDAYTQTLTAIVTGYRPTVDLYRYDGSLFTLDGRVPIISDGTNEVVEFRNPCDADCDSISQYCMYFNPTLVMNYVAGNQQCSGMGAFIADDLSADKNSWFKKAMAGQKAWLGLTYFDGKWVFQHDDGTSIAVPDGINFWSDGKTPDGSAGTCAYFYNGFWYAAQCDERHLVVCQKHMFDPNSEPSNLGDDDLSPGKYYLYVTTALDSPSKACDVEVRVQSDLNVGFGFVDGLRKDEPHPVANIDSDQNRVVSSISIGTERTQTAIVQHVQLRSDDDASLLLEAATFTYRLGCSYEYVSQPLTCAETNDEDFSVVIIGEDDTGNTFQRYSTSLCFKWYVCYNGGVYSNGQCFCPDYFTGDDCSVPVCQNGGTHLQAGKQCKCPKGLAGDACQYVQCDADSGATFSNDDKTLALVIEKSQNTADAIQSLANNFPPTDRKDWIKYYLLESFTVDGKVDDIVLYTDAAAVSARLVELATESRDIAGSCQAATWNALAALLNSPYLRNLSGSEVLLISAAAPIDTDIASIHATMEMFGTETPVVDFIHVENPVCKIDDWATGLSNFATFLATTGGMFYRVTPPLTGVALGLFVPTRYATQRLSYTNPLKCKNNEIFIQVDQGMQAYGKVYIAVGGVASVIIETPLQGVTGAVEMWESDYQNLWSFAPSSPGIYKVTVNSQDNACFPSVYGNGGAQVFFGFVQSYDHDDSPKPYAVYGVVNFPVFYLYDAKTGNTSTTETLYMAHMDTQSFDGIAEVSYDSDTDLRVGCSYNYIGKAFTGVDAYNQPFTRQTTSYCKKDGYAVSTTAKAPPSSSPTVPTVTPPKVDATSTTATTPSTAKPPPTTTTTVTPKSTAKTTTAPPSTTSSALPTLVITSAATTTPVPTTTSLVETASISRAVAIVLAAIMMQ